MSGCASCGGGPCRWDDQAERHPDAPPMAVSAVLTAEMARDPYTYQATVQELAARLQLQPGDGYDVRLRETVQVTVSHAAATP